MDKRCVLLLVLALLCCAVPAMAREVFYYNDLATDPGWTTEGQWAYGSEDSCCGGEPHSGTGMYMHGPDAYYAPNLGAEALTSLPIDCTGKHGVELDYWYAYRTCSGDQVAVQVSNNDADWVTIWSAGCGSTDWQQAGYDISEVADDQPTVYVRWVLGPTNESSESWGMRVDDVMLTADSPTPALEVLLYDEWSDSAIVNGNITGLLYQRIGNVLVEQDAGVECNEGMDCLLEGKQVVLIPLAESNGGPSALASRSGGPLRPLVGENNCLMNCGDNVGQSLQSFVQNGGTAVIIGETYGLSGFAQASGLMDAEWAGAYTADTQFTALFPDHPLLADTAEPILSQVLTNSYLVGGDAQTLLADPADKAVVACRQLGRGAVVLIGYNYETYDGNAAAILANAVRYPRSRLNVLLYDEDTVNHVGWEALNRSYLPYTTATSETFDALLASQDWDLVVVDAPGAQPESWGGLVGYIQNGGRALLSSPALWQNENLADAFGVSAITELALLPEIHPTGPGLALFQDVPNLAAWGDNWEGPGGYALSLTDEDAEVFAEFDVSPTAPARAALVLGNGGRTFANGFTWDDRDQNNDGDEVQDVVELVRNEIEYLLTASGADFGGTPTVGVPPLEVTFTDLSANQPETWTWDFGDGSYSTDQNPTHTYEEPGRYTVALTTFGQYGEDTKTKSAYVYVLLPPVADFSAAPTVGPIPLTVEFTDQSENAPTSWTWSFGDGAASTDQNPSHQYSAVGSYTVGLTVTNEVGEDTEVKEGYITANSPAPVADFVAVSTSGPRPLTVQFLDLSTNSPTSWTWTFGDGATSALQNPSHQYADEGLYTVSLTVANITGSDSLTRADYIVVNPQVPVVDFTGSPTSGIVPLTVAFTDLSTNDPDYHFWTFGDGATSTASSPSHQYAQVGVYTVTLTAANESGAGSRTRVAYITVNPQGPVAAFIAEPTAGAAPLVVSFADTSTNGPTSWSWSFGDGGTSTAQHPSHTYTTPSCYNVSLTVANSGGSDTEIKPDYVVVAFSDITEGQWAFDAIMACYAAGIVQGYWDGCYRPDLPVDRAQMAAFIARAMAGGDGNVPAGPGSATYPDVPTDHWAFKYVEYAHAQGVVTGYWDGYHPDDVVDRGQMAAFIARAMCDGDENVPDDANGVPTFPDVTADGPWSWAYKYVEYIAGEGVATGYPNGTYHPEFAVSRDQMAVFIQRAFDLPTPGT